MAESIVYLKVDSQDYDRKIKNAAEGLQHYAEACKKAGGTLEYVDEEALEFAKGLGQMETVATSASGRVSELSKAFTDLSVQYKQMTDAEKQGEWGVALSESMAQLKTRIADIKTAMADANFDLKISDGGLSVAIEQIGRLTDEVRSSGKTFEDASQDQIEFIQSLGNVATKGTTAKAQLREYSDAITSLTATYRTMTAEEKQSDFGRGLAASIDELKAKAATLKDIMSDTNIELKNLASDTVFTDGIGLMTRTVGSCAAAITAWSGEGKEMEVVVKELAKIGATVAAVDSLTKAFQKQNLVLLKNPYVAAAAALVAMAVAIGKVIKKSQELSAVEKTLQEVEQKGREGAAQEVTRIDTLNNILHDNTRSLEDRKNALSEIQALVPDYHGALTEEGNLINDNTGAIDDYIDSLQRAAIAQAAFDKMVELQKKKMEEQVKLQKAQAELEKQQAAASQPISKDQMMAQAGMGRNVYGSVANTNQTLVDAAQGEVNKIQKVIDEQDAQINALRDLVKSNDIGTTGDKTSKSVGTVKVAAEIELPEGSAAKLKAKIAELRKQWEMATSQGERDSLDGQIKAAEEELAKMTPQVEQVADVIRDAAMMWGEHVDKIKDTEDRLSEFKAMIEDMSLSQEQRDWAAGMADAYQEQLDKMKGVTEEAVDDIKSKMEELPSIFDQNREALDRMSAGVGAISTLGNAFNDLKGIGEDLASAFSGEMDAWDSLMTVFNSGISIMQTVIGVMEAINTLQELSVALSGKKKAEQAAETAEVVGGKMAESTANLTEAGTSMTAAGADAAESSAKAGKAVSWIPIVGPILAVAAIATVLAATFAAMSKAKSAGKFAQGGVVGGNSYSGDRLMAYVNSGETILTPSQADKAMAGIQGNPMQNLQLSTEISGTNLRIVMNNDNRSKGGSRGYYANIH